MTRVFVVDTTYLNEFYSVPRCSEPRFSEALIARMGQEVRGRFHVPVGCLYKLCDHIADARDGRLRRQLAHRVARDARSSVDLAQPWVISPSAWMMSPSAGLAVLAKSVRAFAEHLGRQELNLTNSETIDIAVGLKKKYASHSNYRVHIWTRNQALKAYEPDAGPNPLI